MHTAGAAHHAGSPGGATVTASTRRAVPVATAERAGAMRGVVRELEQWRAGALPDPTAPLEADDIAHLLRDCLQALGVDASVGEGFSVNTVHYYRRKDILDAPEGKTSSARYGVRHLWQAVGARLAGHLGLVTLAEARAAMRGTDENALMLFVARRVLDARARHVARRAPPGLARPLTTTHRATSARSLRGAGPAMAASMTGQPMTARGASAVIVPLPGDAWCVLPVTHPAHQSAAAARTLVRALAAALHVSSDTVEP